MAMKMSRASSDSAVSFMTAPDNVVHQVTSSAGSPNVPSDTRARVPGEYQGTGMEALKVSGYIPTQIAEAPRTGLLEGQLLRPRDTAKDHPVHGLGITLPDPINEKQSMGDGQRGQQQQGEGDYFDYKAVPSHKTKSPSPDPEEKPHRAAGKPFDPGDDGLEDHTGISPRETNTYKYDALPDGAHQKIIRVIDIVPRQESPLLTLRMRVVDLADDPEYEAISYCWGAPVFNRKVLIDGQGVIAITTSLDGVLRQLRDRKHVRTVWADAICINQADIEERNSQVQLMRDIYRKSKRVIAWLGTANNESDVGMDVVPRIINALQKKQAHRDPRLLRHVPDAMLLKYGFPQRNSLALKCLFGIFARPWFRRVWIIQELALAPDALLLCGDKSARWDLFQTATYECWGNLVTFTESNAIKSGWYFADSIIQPTKGEIGAGKTPHLVNLVARSSVTFATDPRDKVFALVGLAKERGRDQGVLSAPDYHLTVEQVYTNFTIENIQKYQNLDVLSLAHRPLIGDESDALDLPSWVPSFSTAAASDPLTGLDQVMALDADESHLSHFTATYNSITVPSFLRGDQRLCVQGHVIDMVAVTGDLMHHQTEEEDKIAYSQRVHNTFSSWEHVSGARSGKRHPTSPIASADDEGEPLLHVYWQVINGGLMKGTTAEVREAFASDYESPISAYRLASAGQAIKNRNCFQIVERIAGWMQDVQNWWRVQWGDHPAEHLVVPGIANCRRVGKTGANRVCLLPGSARPGDQIALLSGAKVPYVIRKEQEEGVWTLVGETYVHGIMFGEAWKEENCHDICLD